MSFRKLPRPGPFEIAPILEYLGADAVPRVYGDGWKPMWCPFHENRRTKAASVSRYGFNCFGCDISGDAIKLLMEREDLEFADAVAKCQELTGVSGDRASRKADAGGWLGDWLSEG